MKKVLITGGAGFIGYRLACNLLERGYQIDLVDNFTRGIKDESLIELSKQDGVNLFNMDLLNKETLGQLGKEYSLIFHLAAIIGVQYVLKLPYDVLTKNVELLQNMILIAKEQKQLERFVFTSTSEVYAGTLKHFSLKIPTPESTPLALTNLSENRTSYMLSKIYGEALCLHSGLPVTIVRPHNFYGPRMGLSHVVPELFKKAFYTEDNKLEVFSPDHKRTFCYIDDAVEMMRKLAEVKVSIGQAFNIGNESPEISIEELAKKIVIVTGKDLTINPGPTTAGSPQRRCPDMSKTFETIWYKPLVSLEEGLKRTFDWYKTNVFLNEGVSAI
ncbi:MAG: NAD-binding protein [Ignavibacteria bacterium GWA2_35_9]|nr:MAG: NAD-binding protein [Ignavibacteria bacterium GWA2_35_9]OGU44760.1 MAG: NAD-binding protein [Ignavibacteria bacterium GWB2_36_8]OGU48730.1 MAG: NAD-binding protein [Ignavibacteria bacterium GWC2_36_12]